MGHWVHVRRGIPVVHFQIAILVLISLAFGAMVTFYALTLQR
jgi:hypothetical protein